MSTLQLYSFTLQLYITALQLYITALHYSFTALHYSFTLILRLFCTLYFSKHNLTHIGQIVYEK